MSRPEAARGRLAVVVPTLDEAERLPRLIESLEGEADELVVVDGLSTDGTAAVARALGARVLLTERGRGRQLAAGARATTAELLVFLHADAALEPGSLAAVRRAFEDPELVAAGFTQRVENERPVFRWIERAANRRVAKRGMIFGDSGLAVRRSTYLAAGGFPDHPLFEDVELSRRLAGLGRIELLRDATVRISSRRWDREGVVLCTARNWLLQAAYWIGLEPRRLARHYEADAATSTPSGAAEPHSTGSARDATESA